MILFADSSALIKLYVSELGSERMLSAVESARVAISPLAVAEVHTTLARKRREGHLLMAEYDRVAAQFEVERDLMILVMPEAAVLARLAGLSRSYVLRGADAFHLASALVLQEEGLETTFATADDNLLAAAREAGPNVLNPMEPLEP